MNLLEPVTAGRVESLPPSLEQQEPEPLVSVVTVTWNRREDVMATVRALYDQHYENIEIVVVDNGSTDGTAAALARQYPEVRVVPLPRNLGVSGGRNAGVEVAVGEIILFLDSDASPAPDTLVEIVRKFHERPDVGVLACKVVNAHTCELDDVAGWVFAEEVKTDQDTEFLSFSFSECGSAFRRQALEHAGLFWERLFFGREGEELAIRIWDADYKILYFPDALVYHRLSPNKRVVGGERYRNDLQNALRIYLVRYPWWLLALFLPLKVVSSLVKGLRKGCLRDILRAFWNVAIEVPMLWRERAPMRNGTARYYVRLQREHGPLRWDLASWLKHKA